MLEHCSPPSAIPETAHSFFPGNLTIFPWGRCFSLQFTRRKLGLRELKKLKTRQLLSDSRI